MRHCRSFKYVRSRTGVRVRRCASYRHPSGRPTSRLAGTGRSPPNKGASCVARQRVYSARLGRYVLRCKTYVGGRVGQRKPPVRKPYGPRCTTRQRVYSPALGKTILRCSKMVWPERGSLQPAPVSGRATPGLSPTSPFSVATESSVPAWATLLRNRMTFVRPGAVPGYKNLTRSARGRERVASSIEHLVRGYPMPAASRMYFENEQRRMRKF